MFKLEGEAVANVVVLARGCALSDEARDAFFWDGTQELIIEVDFVPLNFVLRIGDAKRQGDASSPHLLFADSSDDNVDEVIVTSDIGIWQCKVLARKQFVRVDLNGAIRWTEEIREAVSVIARARPISHRSGSISSETGKIHTSGINISKIAHGKTFRFR